MASEETLVARASAAKSWSVLANGRLGLEMPPMPGGKQVYLSTNLKTRLCEHGETASLILQWCAKQLTRPATTKCTCLNVDGLTAGRFSIPPKDWVGPPRYYDVLVSSGSEELILPGGRAARRLLHMDGAYMLANGTNSTTHTNTQVTSSACAHKHTHKHTTATANTGNIRCRHGNSEGTLRSIHKSTAAGKKSNARHTCGCRMGPQPWRATRLQTVDGKRKW